MYSCEGMQNYYNEVMKKRAAFLLLNLQKKMLTEDDVDGVSHSSLPSFISDSLAAIPPRVNIFFPHENWSPT